MAFDLPSFMMGAGSGGEAPSYTPGKNIDITNNKISTKDDMSINSLALPSGDLQETLDAKQAKLTAGNNISIENNVISSISKTYMPLKDSWKVSSTPGGLTLREFCTAINNDSSVVEGNAFCGNINSNNFFNGMYTTSGSQVGSAEVSVQIMGPWQDGHVQLLTVTSSNNPPYLWQYTWVDGLASWVSWSDVRPVSSGTTNQLLDYVSINGEQYKIANLPSYNSSDEGKILKIVGGVPTWVSE